jgi:hypothetical protein
MITMPKMIMAVILVFALTGTPVSAQTGGGDRFQVPQGCTAFLTVQSRGCSVSHYWTCQGAPDGHHWRVTMDQDGPFHLAMHDREFRWLQTWILRANITATLVEPEQDPANLTELLSTGSDTMAFSMRFDGPGGSAQRDYTGFDQLTGSRTEIDGRDLLITEFSYQYETTDGMIRTSGNQFVDPDWRLFFGGIETSTDALGATQQEDRSPVDFIEPGEDGFLTLDPAYDCSVIMSSLPAGQGDAPIIQ